MPKIALPGWPPNAAFDRSAQRSERRIARSASSREHGSLTHSSNCIWMSEPSSRWISIDRSGVSSWREPSMCDWNVTPVLAELPELREAHHLEAAGVGEDRMRPVHELVQAAERGDALRAGRQHQMVGVGENDVGAERPDRLGMHRLDRRRRADRHEGGRADVAARRRDLAEPGRAVDGADGEGNVVSHADGRSSSLGRRSRGRRRRRNRSDSPLRSRARKPPACARAR